MSRYENPILKGTYPDPSICRVGEDYYLVTSSFCYFPGVPIFHSTDLIHWSQIGHCLTRKSQLNLDNIQSFHGIYAPTIRFHNGRFYMVTTLVAGGGNFYVWTDDPTGVWSEPIWLEQEGIDPSFLFDDDGRVYLNTSGAPAGIIQSEIDLKTGKMLVPPRLIWEGTGGRYPEGPHLYHIGAYYYLMISEGGTEYAHRLTLARSRSPWGPFEACPNNPIFTHMHLPMEPLQAVGHADLIQDVAGNWWIVCLAIRPSNFSFSTHHLGRETILVPAQWDANDWLVINEGKPASLSMEIDVLPQTRKIETKRRDDFNQLALDFSWNFIRTPHKDFWTLEAQPGWLRLVGNGHTLDEGDSPSFIGRRQQEFDCHIRALIDYEPQFPGDEAGLTIYQNEEHHYEIFLARENDQRCVVVRQRIGVLVSSVIKQPISSGNVTLAVHATAEEYAFAYELEGKSYPLTTARTRYLSSEVAKGFTGTFIGMYVYGETPAYWDWFEY